MKSILSLLAGLFCTSAFAQDPAQGRVQLELTDTMSGVQDRSTIAASCAKVADAAVSAHAAGKLSEVINQAAKAKQTGSSDDPYFNSLVRSYSFDPRDDFIFSALFFSQLNIKLLEQKQPYQSGLESLYKAYVAASCAQVAKISRSDKS
ncbi:MULTISPECIES: hypothetical protein [Xanthomonas]|uniref:hypothetical protein n=1 Tax=Xanthomonas TaxID=338 RepID=UPI001115A736|nr:MULTISPECIES: hypothetical protein [Xanthomonas]MCC5092680.1 hypothetical protein [Xanthomonas campestris pv. incanae]MDV2453222.1 hypothetical protein [Xanthomonas hortorum NBC5720]MEA0762811.1 hypothetical protein [Xanthomonas campestris pv. campestris]MEA9610329.1 hypothetical protein [Xanthomonas campestris pv. incanae]MEA9621507.1 hypothetical protein [Xanthomonas campestris pv. incanae]